MPLFCGIPKAAAAIDLFIDSAEELKELYERGQAPKTKSYLSKKEDNTRRVPPSLSQPSRVSDIRKKDPVFVNVEDLRDAVSAGTDETGMIRKDIPEDSQVREIISKVDKEAVAQEPLEPSKLQGLAFIGDLSLLNEEQVSGLYWKERTVRGAKIQALALGESGITGAVEKSFPALQAFLGKPIDLDMIDEIVAVVKARVRESNIPFTNIYAPPQEVRDGIVYMVIEPAVVEDIMIAESEYFDERKLLARIDQRLGEPVNTKALERNITALSLHPDRELKTTFEAGEGENTTRVAIDVQEQRPWRVFAGLSNDGVKELDERQTMLGGYHNNLWGLEHRGFYQYTASLDRSSLKSHNLQYGVPWLDRNLLSLNYSRSVTQAEVLDGAFETEGRFTLAGIRNETALLDPLLVSSRFGDWKIEDQKISAGIEKKEITGDILFTLFGEPLDTGAGANVEVVNSVIEYSGKLEDPFKGLTTFDIELTYSPGGLTSKNNDEDFETARQGADAHYLYFNLNAIRSTTLPWQFLEKPLSLETGFTGQFSPERLIGSERFVNAYRPGFRGYEQGIYSGDSGLAGYIELESSPFNIITRDWYKDALSGSLFSDFGIFFNRDADDLEDSRTSLLSVGASLNYRINDKISSELVFSHDLTGKNDEETQTILYRLLVSH